MSFTANKSLMEGGASLLLQGATGDMADLFTRCAAGLQNLAAYAELYDEQIRTARDFAAHFEQELRLLQAMAKKQFVKTASYDVPVLWDTAFGLLEDLAVFTREKVLRTGFADATETEGSLLCYFETSGYWKAGDGTLVSEAYYVTLPATVLHEMLTLLKRGKGDDFSPTPAAAAQSGRSVKRKSEAMARPYLPESDSFS